MWQHRESKNCCTKYIHRLVYNMRVIWETPKPLKSVVPDFFFLPTPVIYPTAWLWLHWYDYKHTHNTADLVIEHVKYISIIRILVTPRKCLVTTLAVATPRLRMTALLHLPPCSSSGLCGVCGVQPHVSPQQTHWKWTVCSQAGWGGAAQPCLCLPTSLRGLSLRSAVTWAREYYCNCNNVSTHLWARKCGQFFL